MPLLSDAQCATWYVWLFGKTRIPLLAYCHPKVLEINDATCSIRIALRRRTRNHLRSMYIAVFAVGADLADFYPIVLEIGRAHV